jgi:prepilin-type processing-associated H-X9-DG protein
MDYIETGEVFRHFQTMSNEFANPKVLICPSAVRVPAKDLFTGFSNTNISYFVGIDARDSNPQMFLSGDRNLTNGPLTSNRILVITPNSPAGWTHEMHSFQGNIGLADGSVQQYSTARLAEGLRNSEATNRLAIP